MSLSLAMFSLGAKTNPDFESNEVKKNVSVYVIPHQNVKDGPVTAIETIEDVRLTFPNGTYLTSTKYPQALDELLREWPGALQHFSQEFGF